MLRFAISRSISLFLCLFLSSILVFLILEVMPGDPAAFMLGLNATPETLAALRDHLDLDVPAVQRYMSWMWGLLHGSLGTSHIYRVAVEGLIVERLFLSVPLAAYALILSILIAFPIGFHAAMAPRGGLVDSSVTVMTQFGLSIPDFWFATLLVMIFSISLGWFSSGGFPGWDAGFFSCMRALTLPAVSLALPQAAILARVVRLSLREASSLGCVQAARARGLTRGRALWRHALPNALAPVLAVVGMQFSFLIAGAIIIENVFFLPGLGRLVFQGVMQRDLILVKNIVVLLTFSVVVISFLADLACAAVDPRLRRAR